MTFDIFSLMSDEDKQPYKDEAEKIRSQHAEQKLRAMVSKYRVLFLYYFD